MYKQLYEKKYKECLLITTGIPGRSFSTQFCSLRPRRFRRQHPFFLQYRQRGLVARDLVAKGDVLHPDTRNKGKQGKHQDDCMRGDAQGKRPTN